MLQFNEAIAPLLYFGKIPSRSDFVKSSHAVPIINVIDQWVSGAMELFAGDPRWKIIYDSHPNLDFAFFGNHTKQVVIGSLVCSQDSSGRRFPFVSAINVEASADGSAFDQTIAFYVAHVWFQTRSWLNISMQLNESALTQLGVGQVRLDTVMPDFLFDEYQVFTQTTTVAMLQSYLIHTKPSLLLRQSIIAIGLLMQPVLTSKSSALNKALTLPLPNDPYLIPLVTAFWMDILWDFMGRMDAEFCLFNRAGTQPVLCLAFNGTSSKALHSLLTDEVDDFQIDVANSSWVEQYIEADYGLTKLSAYAQQADFSLHSLKKTFSEVFLGS